MADEIAIDLTEEELVSLRNRANAQSHERGYRSGGGEWKPGLATPPSGFTRESFPPYVGFLGEKAFELYINDDVGFGLLKTDTQAKTNGDGGTDFVLLNQKIQVKTRRRPLNINLVIRIKEDGSVCPLDSDIHVFAEVDSEPRNRVYLLGWAWTDDFRYRVEVPARKGKHKNVEIKDSELNAMPSLLDMLVVMDESSHGTD